MNFNELLNTLRARLAAMSLRTRILLGAGVALVLALSLLYSVGDNVGADAYLFTGLDAQDAGDIIGKLKEQRVPYTIEAGGSAIMVPQNKVHELRLALAQAGLPKGGGVGFEIFDKPSYGQSEFVQQKNYLRALQGELERTIAAISAVQKARVHLVLPEKRLFREPNEGAQASVVVKVRAGRVISESQAAGIVHLVASSVPGLSPERVTLLDDLGRLLAAPGQGSGLSSEDLDYKRKLEHSLEEKVRGILDTALGASQANVQVSAELDFSKVERVEEIYDPERRVLRSEQMSDEHAESKTPATGGVPGVKNNLPGLATAADASPQQGGNNSGKKSETRNYEVSKVVSRTTHAPARVQRLSAAVLVDGKMDEQELEALSAIVRQALGLDDKRGDQLALRSVSFRTNEEEPKEELPKALVMLRDNARPVATLLVGLAAALILLMLVISALRASRHALPAIAQGPRSLREVEAMMRGAPQIAPSNPADMALKGAVMQDNQKAASVIRGWLHEAKS